jgi:hypothetical protein
MPLVIRQGWSLIMAALLNQHLLLLAGFEFGELPGHLSTPIPFLGFQRGGTLFGGR